MRFGPNPGIVFFTRRHVQVCNSLLPLRCFFGLVAAPMQQREIPHGRASLDSKGRALGPYASVRFAPRPHWHAHAFGPRCGCAHFLCRSKCCACCRSLAQRGALRCPVSARCCTPGSTYRPTRRTASPRSRCWSTQAHLHRGQPPNSFVLAPLGVAALGECLGVWKKA